jgi:hypothetical protein
VKRRWIAIGGVVVLVGGISYGIWGVRRVYDDFGGAMAGARACPAIEQRIGAPYDATPFPRCKASRSAEKCVVLVGPRGSGEFRYQSTPQGYEGRFTFGEESFDVGKCAMQNIAAEKQRGLEGCAKDDPDACERAAWFIGYLKGTEEDRRQASELREKAKRLRAGKP